MKSLLVLFITVLSVSAQAQFWQRNTMSTIDAVQLVPYTHPDHFTEHHVDWMRVSVKPNSEKLLRKVKAQKLTMKITFQREGVNAAGEKVLSFKEERFDFDQNYLLKIPISEVEKEYGHIKDMSLLYKNKQIGFFPDLLKTYGRASTSSSIAEIKVKMNLSEK